MSEEYFAKKISLRPDEQIADILHHHPITFAKQIFITAILILGSFFLMFYLFSQGAFGVALFLAILLTGLFYGLREFYLWYLNVFIITNQRIFDFEQKGFFNKVVSEIPYEKILDISYAIKGFWQTVLKLGTIKIQAAGTTLIIKNISNIVNINQSITDLIKDQTGKKIEVKEVQQINSKVKEQLTNDFLNHEKLTAYEDYNLAELIVEYKDIFGDLKLKKLLVDELEKYDESSEQVDKDSQVLKEENEEGKDLLAGKFKQKKL